MEETNTNFEMEIEHFNPEVQEDNNWMDKTGLTLDTLCGAIETVVFMSEKPVSILKIKGLVSDYIPLRVIHECIERLQIGYEESHHGLRLQEVAEGYQFRTKATYSKYVQDLFKVNSIMLTPSALEVLAIIAYKQPISSSEIERVRGVDSSHLVRALMDKRLVRTAGRSEEELGRPTVFVTTSEFLEVFNLPSLSQLPSEHELTELATSTPGNIGDIKAIVSGAHRPEFKLEELTELDDLAKIIKEITTDTNFTKLLSDEDKKRLHGDSDIKSAFDILEEQVIFDLISKQNKVAIESETLTSGPEARVVDLEIETGLLNTPELETELDAINPIEEESPSLTDIEFTHHMDEDEFELDFTDDENDESDEEEEAEEDDENYDDFEVNEKIIAKAKELDLDLEFLREDSNDLSDLKKDLDIK